MKPALVFDWAYLDHETWGHLESPKRLKVTYAELESSGVLEKIDVIKPRPATLAEVELVHVPVYIREVRDFSARGGGVFFQDTVGSAKTYETALLAAGGALTAVDAVIKGGARGAFALVRPPGHHAKPDKGMGFCFFNNAAIAARYAQEQYGIKRVLIVDWDEHHGNGTEYIFYRNPSVLYFSVHRDWSYPATGWASKVGEGDGRGYNINVPLPKRSGNADYEYALWEVLVPVAGQFKPELVLVSAGMDAHERDPIGMMKLTAAGYARLAGIVNEIAYSCSGKGPVYILEGGYHPPSLAECVLSVFHALLGGGGAQGEEAAQKRPAAGTGTVKRGVLEAVGEVKKHHAPYWEFK